MKSEKKKESDGLEIQCRCAAFAQVYPQLSGFHLNREVKLTIYKIKKQNIAKQPRQ